MDEHKAPNSKESGPKKEAGEEGGDKKIPDKYKKIRECIQAVGELKRTLKMYGLMTYQITPLVAAIDDAIDAEDFAQVQKLINQIPTILKKSSVLVVGAGFGPRASLKSSSFWGASDGT